MSAHIEDVQVKVEDWMVGRIAAALGVPAEEVVPDAAFMELGLSSVQAVELSCDLEEWSGLTLSPTLVFDHPTIEAAAAHVAEELAAAGRVPAS